MLAYLFWHRPESPERPGPYEEALVAFHRRLAGAGLPFLLGSATYRVRGAPWLPGGAGYEDWYLVPGFAELGTLNEAAVAAALRPGHDRVAGLAAWGTGGLYAVVQGEPAWRASACTWLGKPAGVPSADFRAGLPDTPYLLQRQLTHGPTPEFCAAGALAGGAVVGREPLLAPTVGAG